MFSRQSLRRARLTALAMHHRIPAIWEWREFTDARGLMSYGSILPEMYRQLGNYTGRILGGEKPAHRAVESVLPDRPAR
jgi:putative ABC transport system substrate-binding protein